MEKQRNILGAEVAAVALASSSSSHPPSAGECRSSLVLADRCSHCDRRQGYVLGLRGFGWRAKRHEERCRTRRERVSVPEVSRSPREGAQESSHASQEGASMEESPKTPEACVEVLYESAGSHEMSVQEACSQKSNLEAEGTPEVSKEILDEGAGSHDMSVQEACSQSSNLEAEGEETPEAAKEVLDEGAGSHDMSVQEACSQSSNLEAEGEETPEASKEVLDEGAGSHDVSEEDACSQCSNAEAESEETPEASKEVLDDGAGSHDMSVQEACSRNSNLEAEGEETPEASKEVLDEGAGSHDMSVQEACSQSSNPETEGDENSEASKKVLDECTGSHDVLEQEAFLQSFDLRVEDEVIEAEDDRASSGENEENEVDEFKTATTEEMSETVDDQEHCDIVTAGGTCEDVKEGTCSDTQEHGLEVQDFYKRPSIGTWLVRLPCPCSGAHAPSCKNESAAASGTEDDVSKDSAEIAEKDVLDLEEPHENRPEVRDFFKRPSVATWLLRLPCHFSSAHAPSCEMEGAVAEDVGKDVTGDSAEIAEDDLHTEVEDGNESIASGDVQEDDGEGSEDTHGDQAMSQESVDEIEKTMSDDSTEFVENDSHQEDDDSEERAKEDGSEDDGEKFYSFCGAGSFASPSSTFCER